VQRIALRGEWYGLHSMLLNLTPKRLLVLAIAYSVANPLLQHIWFALEGYTHNLVESFFMMFAGDPSGALIMLYALKGILAMLPVRGKSQT
jgi:hypothetical protein